MMMMMMMMVVVVVRMIWNLIDVGVADEEEDNEDADDLNEAKNRAPFLYSYLTHSKTKTSRLHNTRNS